MPRNCLRRPGRPAIAALAALFFSIPALAAGCGGGSISPSGSRAPIGPGGEGGGRPGADGPLAVVFGAPRGPASNASQITLVMSRPMRSLELAGDESPAFASITPAVRGRWQWVGTSGIIFAPEGRLPRATAYRVEVPAGTKALDGSALAAPYKLELSTARPGVESVTPSTPPERLDAKATFDIHFNQPITDAEAARALTLSAAGKRIDFDVHRQDPKDESRIEIAPRAKLPLNSAIRIEAAADLRGVEGPLTAGSASSFDFKTYGPLQVTRAGCGYPDDVCPPGDGSITVELTNFVKADDLLKAVEIDPPVPMTADSYGEEEGTGEVWLRLKLAPSTKYRLRIKAGLKDVYGQALGATFERALTVAPFDPDARLALNGTIFDPSARRDFPIAALNLNEIELATASLNEQGVLDMLGTPDDNGYERWESPPFEAVIKAKGSRQSLLKPKAALNTPWSQLLRSDDILGTKDHRGAYATAIRYENKDRKSKETHSALIQVTDLAITAKISRFGSLVRVTRISTAEPVAGATVSVRRPKAAPGAAPIATAQTDAGGFATIPTSSFKPSTSSYEEDAVLFANVGSEWTFRRARDAVSTSGVWSSLYEPPMLALVFTDRPIYRPGDVVHVKAIFRGEGPLGVGLATPSGKEVTLTGKGEGSTFATASKTLSAFGTVHAEMKIPADAKLGYYTIEALIPGNEGSDRASFTVAEYRPNEARVVLKSDKPAYIRGEKAHFTARGEYLFGAPVPGADAHVYVTREHASFTPPGLPDAFNVDDAPYFSDLPRVYPTSRLISIDGRLDAKGMMDITAPLDMPSQRGAETLRCDVMMTDLSRQGVADRIEALIHPADFYVALRPPANRILPAGTEIRPEILTVDPKGARVPGVPVRVELLERVWKPVPGKRAWESPPTDRVVASCSLTSGDKPAQCALTPPSAGYYILHATAADKRGNAASASSYIYATGQGEPSWSRRPGVDIDIVPDKLTYDVGQTARILVKSPFPSATALVTVEQSGIMIRRTMDVTGPTPVIDVPITDEMWPNAYVSVALFRPAQGSSLGKPALTDPSAKDAPAGAAVFRIGYAELSLDPNRHKVAVALKPSAADARPGSPVDVDIETRDRAGSPVRAEVTLYAVDEGVLSLAEEKKPDPLALFAERRALGVETIESREDLARVLDPNVALFPAPSVRMGATSVSREPRQDFRTVAYYNPSIITDAKGRARVSFKLPDGLTSYRLTAVAVTDGDKAGVAEGRITASLPLMARPALPRFFRAGDAIEAGVIVTSKLPGKTKVEVEARAEGMTLTGEPKRAIEIGQGESTEVRFALAAPKPGSAKLRFEAKSASASDAVAVTREIRSPGAFTAVALYGDTDAKSEERLGDLSAIRNDVGGLELRLSSSALVGLDGGIEQLLDYPYGCTEQLTSRLVPLLPLRELARDYSIALPSNIEGVIASTVEKIAQNQHRNGGFGLWKDSPETSDWVTAYALFGLGEAKRYGARVPQVVLDRAASYLMDTIEHGAGDIEERASIAFALDVLANNALSLSDKTSSASLKNKVMALYAERIKLPLFAQALLAHAMVKVGAGRDAIDRITAELEGNLRLDGPTARAIVSGNGRFADLLDSDTRTSALVLRALLAAKPTHPLAHKLAMGILGDRRGGAWRTTQEAAWALLALDLYRRAEERASPDFIARVSLGDAALEEAPFRGRSVLEVKRSVPAAKLAGSSGTSLGFTVDGEGHLFYEARLRYIPTTPPRQPMDRGFFIKKTLRPVTPDGLEEALAIVPESSQSTFRGGELVLVDIVVVTPSPRQYVVVDDPIPAGLEAIDTGLLSTSQALRDGLLETRRGRSDNGSYSFAWARQELRDDRALFFIDRMPAGMYRYRYLARATTLGVFTAPPSRVEEMYTPEVFGRTGADVVKIVTQ